MQQDLVNVCIRFRPLIEREFASQMPKFWTSKSNIIHKLDDNGQIHSNQQAFVFDHVFDYTCGTETVYDTMAKTLINKTMEGFNGTIFAYGQTSTGKTYTMMGSRTEPGIIPRSIDEVFEFISKNHDMEFLLRVSYMEIYNEDISDLLKPGNSNLKIRTNERNEIFVEQLTETTVASKDEILHLMEKGENYRHTGQTNMNERSSRSHTVFRLIIESRRKKPDDESEDYDGAVKVSRLNLVDLAGSERARNTGAQGTRLKESGYINKSLLTLGTVISKLSEEDSGFVPYRDSKLTRILQDSLGGNSKTVIICTVTPVSLEVTESTLKFATRAKRIKNKPQVNEVVDGDTMLRRYKMQIKSLESQINTMKAGNDVTKMEELLEEKTRREAEQQQQIAALKKMIVCSQTCEKKPKPSKRRQTICAGYLSNPKKLSLSTIDDEDEMGTPCDFDVPEPKRSRHSDVTLGIVKRQSVSRLKDAGCQTQDDSGQEEECWQRKAEDAMREKERVLEGVENLQKQIDLVLEEKNDEIARLKEFEEKCEFLESEIDFTRKDLTDREKDVSEMKQELVDLREQLKAGSHSSPSISADSEFETECEHLRWALSEKEQLHDSLATEKGKLEELVLSIKNELSVKDEEIAAIAEQLTACQEELNQERTERNEIAKLLKCSQDEIVPLQKKLSDMESDMINHEEAEMMERVKALERENAELKASIERLSKETSGGVEDKEGNDRNEDEREALASDEFEKDELRMMIREAEDQVNDLTKEIESLKAKDQSHREVLAEKEDSVLELAKELEEGRMREEKYLEKITKLESVKESFDEKLCEADRQIEKLQDEVKQKDSTEEHLTNWNKSLEKKVTTVMDALQERNEKEQDSKNRIRNLELEREDLLTKLEEMKMRNYELAEKVDRSLEDYNVSATTDNSDNITQTNLSTAESKEECMDDVKGTESSEVYSDKNEEHVEDKDIDSNDTATKIRALESEKDALLAKLKEAELKLLASNQEHCADAKDEGEGSDAQDEVERLRTDLKDTIDRLEKAEEEKSNMLIEDGRIRQKVNEYETLISELQQNLIDIKNEAEMTKSELLQQKEDFASEITKFESRMQESVTREDMLLSEIKILESGKENLENRVSEVESLRAKVEELLKSQEQYELEKQDVDKAGDQALKDVMKEVVELKQQRDELKATVDALSQKLSKQIEHDDVAAGGENVAPEEVSSGEAQANEAFKDVMQGVDDLKQQLDVSEPMLDALSQKGPEHTEDGEGASVRKPVTLEEISSKEAWMTEALKTMELEKIDLEKKLNDAYTQVRDLRSSLEQLMQSSDVIFNHSQQSQSSVLITSIQTSSESDGGKVEAEIEGLVADSAEIKQPQPQSEKYDEAEVIRLKQVICQLQEQLSSHKESGEQVNSAVLDVQASIDEKQDTDNQNVDYKEQLSTLSSQKEVLQTKLSAYEATLAENKQEIENLKELIAGTVELENENKLLTEQVDDYRVREEKCMDELHTERSEKESILMQFDIAKTELVSLREKVDASLELTHQIDELNHALRESKQRGQEDASALSCLLKEKEELLRKITGLETEIEEVRQQNISMEEIAEEKERIVINLAELKVLVAEAEAKEKEYCDQFTALNLENKQLQSSLKIKENEIAKLLQESGSLAALTEENDRLQKAQEDLSLKIEEAECEKQRLADELSTIRDEFDSLKKTLESKEAEIMKIREELTCKSVDSQKVQQLQLSVEDLTQQIDNAQVRNDQYVAELQDLRSNAETLNSTISQQKEQIASLYQESELYKELKIKCSQFESKCDELQLEFEQAKEREKNLTQELSKTKSENETLQLDIGNAYKEIATLTQKIEEFENQNTTSSQEQVDKKLALLQDQLRDQERHYSKMLANSESQKEDALASLQASLQARFEVIVKELQEQKAHEVHSERAMLDELEKENVRLLKKVTSLENETESLRTDIFNETQARKNAEKDRKDQKFVFTQQIESLKTDLSETKMKLEEAKAVRNEKDQPVKVIDVTDSMSNAFKSHSESMKRQLEGRDASYAELSVKYHQSLDELDDLKQKVSSLSKLAGDRDSELESVIQHFKMMKSDKERLEAELSKNLKKDQENLEQCQTKNKKLESDVTELVKTVESLKTHNDKLQDTIKNDSRVKALEQDLEEKKDKLVEVNVQLIRVNMKNDKLDHTLKRARQEFEERDEAKNKRIHAYIAEVRRLENMMSEREATISGSGITKPDPTIGMVPETLISQTKTELIRAQNELEESSRKVRRLEVENTRLGLGHCDITNKYEMLQSEFNHYKQENEKRLKEKNRVIAELKSSTGDVTTKEGHSKVPPEVKGRPLSTCTTIENQENQRSLRKMSTKSQEEYDRKCDKLLDFCTNQKPEQESHPEPPTQKLSFDDFLKRHRNNEKASKSARTQSYSSQRKQIREGEEEKLPSWLQDYEKKDDCKQQ